MRAWSESDACACGSVVCLPLFEPAGAAVCAQEQAQEPPLETPQQGCLRGGLCVYTYTCRFGGGVPAKQYDLIKKDGLPVDVYIARTFDGVAENSHLRSSNYFYYNCLTGHFLRDNCPAYLKEPAFRQLKVWTAGEGPSW